jgi:hypothetical protein
MVFKCENCNKEYKKNDSLQQHIRWKHSAAQSLQCVKCDKHFLNKRSLNKHLYQVHPSKLHYCTFCGSSFKVNSNEIKLFRILCVINWLYLFFDKKD